jgi:hypothetical protein
MASRRPPALAVALALSICAVPSARADLAIDSRGELGTEARVFYPDDTEDTYIGNVAMVGRLQVDAEFDSRGDLAARVRVFSRLDPYDDVRTRVVPEEVYVSGELDPFRLRVGFQMLNWSATEAFHPADVINSRILDGAFENPEKIGELMAALRLEIPLGNIEVYAMPLFTAPVFPSARSPLSFAGQGVALGNPLVLERDGDLDEQRFQPQWAAQVQQTWGDADVSVHVMHHIDRELPQVVFDVDSGEPRPVFQSVLQVGGTYQHALAGTVLKLEAAYRRYDRPDGGVPGGAPNVLGTIERRDAVIIAAGIEHGVSRGDGSDTALILEGQVLIPTHDDYPKLLEPLFQHDVLIGMRHAFNDEQSTALLFTVIVDVVNPEQLIMGAALNRRLGEEWGLSTGLRLIRYPPEQSSAPLLFENLHDDHQLYVDLRRYF